MGVILLGSKRCLAGEAAEHQDADVGIEDRRKAGEQGWWDGFACGGHARILPKGAAQPSA
ncbi:hypothetical protein GCM10027343_16930 [Noviherbaspirillum agri]